MSSKAAFTPTLPCWIELSLGEGRERHVFFKRKKGARFSVEQLAIAVGTKGESTECEKRKDVGECVYTWVVRGAAPWPRLPLFGRILHSMDGLGVILHSSFSTKSEIHVVCIPLEFTCKVDFS